MIVQRGVGGFFLGRGAVVGDPKSGPRRRRAVGTRNRIMSHLALTGEIRDEAGMASTVLAAEVGYPGTSIAFAQLLSGMERAGLIEREVRGKRTYRIAAVPGAAAQMAATERNPARPASDARPAGPRPRWSAKRAAVTSPRPARATLTMTNWPGGC